ncbi:hypothetical protein [Nitrosomonas sp. Nm132]|uniref:hypothetical protein n=1 Tax=Nitrosomonas sp. Nm132 TaxID=1881053 RepID=UPI00088CEBFD|nr:hypothetical protein [Nitrosomonas sp. Nm132]SDH27292.1 hypothetical protein SAMN05428952_100977 [Nitrosomonas sp. Nm132]
MIRFVQPIASGNAIRLLLSLVAGAGKWRVLRKETDDFSGFDDPNAFLVYEGDEGTVVDHQFLVNDQLYYYKAYYWVNSAWLASATATGMPHASYEEASTDVLSLLRDRLDYGFRVEVERGVITHEYNAVPILTAPPVFEDTRWPCVTVHLESESPAERGLGEAFMPDFYNQDEDAWEVHEGWLASVQLQIVTWSLNPDERIEMRKAVRRIIQANLSLFDHEGMIKIETSQRDVEDFTSYQAPVYQSMCSFSCIAPAQIRMDDPNIIRQVNSTIVFTE